MRKIDDPFTYYYEKIDLHGMTKVEAVVRVKEAITDCIKLKKYDIMIVHGKGTGVIKREVQDYLKKDKRVLSYKIDNFNEGVTLVKLKGEEYE